MLDLWNEHTTRHFGRAAKALNSLKNGEKRDRGFEPHKCLLLLFLLSIKKRFINLL